MLEVASKVPVIILNSLHRAPALYLNVFKKLPLGILRVHYPSVYRDNIVRSPDYTRLAHLGKAW